MKQYDVFISYRREGGFNMADSIYQRLINAGYSAFLDVEQLNSGKFNTKLLSVIEQCKDFILILPPCALDRCVHEDDWVRQEVEHAMKCGKNIVPIMLRGFEWPLPDELPESLKDLSNYNGISASDHNVFVENVERLKRNFLLSKPGFTWHKYRKIMLPLLILLILAGGCVFGWYMNRQKKYELLCNELSIKMMNEFVKIHHDVGVAENVLDAWRDFKRDYAEGDLEYSRNDLKSALTHYKKEIKEPIDLQLTESEREVLRTYAIELEELDAFPVIMNMAYDDVVDYFDLVDKIAEQELSELLDNNVQYGFDYIKIGLKANYYALLSFYTTMPDCIYEKLQKVVPQLTYMSGIPLRLSKSEYEAMQEAAINELEELINKMGGDLQEVKMDVDVMREKLDRMTEEFETRFGKQGLSIVDKMAEIDTRKGELAELDRKLIEMYRTALQKNALLPSDEQGIMWGKILRIARFAEIAKNTELQQKEEQQRLLEEAKRKGLSTEGLNASFQTITAQDWYDSVDKWLVEYLRLREDDKNADKYVTSVRAYYKAVHEGKLDSQTGVVLVGTKGDEKHPIYEVGDIIIERQGKSIHGVKDYFNAKDSSDNIVVSFLRLENGVLHKKTQRFSADCPVLIGLSPLHE